MAQQPLGGGGLDGIDGYSSASPGSSVGGSSGYARSHESEAPPAAPPPASRLRANQPAPPSPNTYGMVVPGLSSMSLGPAGPAGQNPNAYLPAAPGGGTIFAPPPQSHQAYGQPHAGSQYPHGGGLGAYGGAGSHGAHPGVHPSAYALPPATGFQQPAQFGRGQPMPYAGHPSLPMPYGGHPPQPVPANPPVVTQPGVARRRLRGPPPPDGGMAVYGLSDMSEGSAGQSPTKVCRTCGQVINRADEAFHIREKHIRKR